MDANKYLVGLVVVLLAVVLGVVYFGQPSVERVVEKVKELGAVPGDTLADCVTQNGQKICRVSGACNERTAGNLFAVRNPLGATSTVQGAFKITQGTTTASITVHIATTTAHQATTSSDYPFGGLVISTQIPKDMTTTIYGGSTASTTEYLSAGTTTPAWGINIGPTQVVYGYATGTTAGLTNTNNTFSCTYNLEFRGL